MAFCDVKPWNMTLVLDKAIGNPQNFTFNLNSDGTGTVNVSGGARMSDLRWACQSFGVFGQQGARGFLSFVFRVRRTGPLGTLERGVVYSGFARQNAGGATIFRGRLSVFGIGNDDDTPAGGSDVTTLAAEPGDTGTGNGTQT
jgi:hypothetical protein